MIDYAKVLANYFITDEWYLDGEDYDGLVWLSDKAKPSRAELDELSAQMEAHFADKEAIKAANKTALLEKLGITSDEAKLLLL
jgi:hypothetical protein